MEADRLARRAARDGQDLPRVRRLAEPAAQLVGRQLRPLEVLLEEGVVGLGDRLDQALVLAGDRGRQVGRRRAFLERARLALVEEGLPGEHVDHAPELRLGADRYLEDGGPGADRLHVLERVLYGRPLAVEAGDESDAREAELPAPPPYLLHLHLHLAPPPPHGQDAAGRGAPTSPR